MEISNASAIFIGGEQYSQMYHGSDLIWPNASYTDTTNNVQYKLVTPPGFENHGYISTTQYTVDANDYITSTVGRLINAIDIDFCRATIGNKEINTIGDLIKWVDDLAEEIRSIPPRHNYANDYLTFEALESGNITWKAIGTSSPAKTISYSINNGAWTSISSSSAGTNISVSAGDKVRFKGNESSYATSNNVYSGFENQSGAKFNIYGNIMSLIYGDNFTGQTSFNGGTYNLCSIFKNSCVVSAENLILPATTLTGHCYRAMFSKATLLEKAPELPATTLAEYCYYYMFDSTKITTAPALPATTVATYCYADMFRGCTSLTTAPATLPATTLAERCYQEMFRGCSSLIIAPALPATTLAGWCYGNMFRDCAVLRTAPTLPATTLANQCYQYMFHSCTSLRTAPELPATTLADYCYQYMFYNCTSLTTAPELPATTLATYCYYYMFHSCTSLNYIKCLAINKSASFCTGYWVSNVAASGTFVKDANTTWTTGTSGIPSGWTTQNA